LVIRGNSQTQCEGRGKMKRGPIRLWLVLSLISMVTIPLLGSFFIVQDILSSSFSLSMQEETIEALEIGQNALKELAKKSPSSADIYRQQFMQMQDVKLNLADQSLLRVGLLNSFSIYFLASFVVLILVAAALALFLNRKVAKAYDSSFSELLKQQERSRFLEEVNHWQDVAKQLAHEIKNPLQPIRTWAKNLLNIYQRQGDSPDFSELLPEAVQSIDHEVNHLQRLVDSFTRFSRLPEIKLQNVELTRFLQEFVRNYQDSWNITCQLRLNDNELIISADPNLLRQVFSNLISNAVEANPNQTVPIRISILANESTVSLTFENQGVCLDVGMREKIFEPYVSTKGTESNFGLGLAIVRKIILEHGGDIRSDDCSTGAKFIIELPLSGDDYGKSV